MLPKIFFIFINLLAMKQKQKKLGKTHYQVFNLNVFYFLNGFI